MAEEQAGALPERRVMTSSQQHARFTTQIKHAVRFSGPQNILQATRFLAQLEGFKRRYPKCFETRDDVDECIESLLEGPARLWWVSVCRGINSTDWNSFRAAFLARWAEPTSVIYQHYLNMRYHTGEDALEWGDAFATYCKALDIQETQGVLHLQHAIQDSLLRSALNDRKPTTVAEAVCILQELVTRNWIVSPPIVASNSHVHNAAHPTPPKSAAYNVYTHHTNNALPATSSNPANSSPSDIHEALQSLTRRFDDLSIKYTELQRQQRYREEHQRRPDNNWRPEPWRQANNRQQHQPPRPAGDHSAETAKAQVVTAVDEPSVLHECTDQELLYVHPVADDLVCQQGNGLEEAVAPVGVNKVSQPFGKTPKPPAICVQQRIPARRVPIVDQPAQAPAQPAPDMPSYRAHAPDIALPEAFTEPDIVDATARRLLAQRTTCTLRELYTIGSNKFRSKVQQHFNNMHTHLESSLSTPATNAVAKIGPNIASDKHAVLVSNTMSCMPEPLLEMDAYINGMRCIITLDTGAQYNVMTSAAAYALQVEIDHDKKVRFKGVDGQPQQSLGSTAANVRLGGENGIVCHQEFMLLDDQDLTGYTILMGLPWFRAMRATIDLHNNKLSAQKDEHTNISFPLLQRKQRSTCVQLMQIDTDEDDDNGDNDDMDLSQVPPYEGTPTPRNSPVHVDINISFNSPFAAQMQPTIQSQKYTPFAAYYTPHGWSHLASHAEYKEEQCVPDDEVNALHETQPLAPFGLDPYTFGSVQLLAREQYEHCFSQSIHIQQADLPSISPVTNVSSTDLLPEEEVESMTVPGFDRPIQVGKDTPQTYRDQLAQLLIHYHDVFAHSMACLRTPARLPPHRISLQMNAKPVAVPVRQKPVMERVAERAMTKEQLEAGLIQTSESPWRFPLMVIKKHIEPGTDASKLTQAELFRVVVDYRLLNDLTISDAYPMPLIYDVIEQAASGHLFSKLDIKSAFYQVPLHEDSRELTAFYTTDGLFEYVRMPMGLKNAPATFARGMKVMLGNSNAAVNYADDLVIPSPLLAAEIDQDALDPVYVDQLGRLRQVFSLMRKHNLKCTSHKCVFLTKATRFVGHILRAGTITTDPMKTRVIDEIDPSKGFAHLQRFLAYVYYYALRQSPHLSARTKMLRNLLVKNAPWRWTDAHQQLVDELKSEVKKRYVLHAPDWNQPFILQTDYSKDGLAAVLSQVDATGTERLVCCASRATTKGESVLSAYEGELTAVVYGVLAFHYYLYGRHFTLVTDHSALQYLSKNKNSNTRMGRIAALLSAEYTFTVQHRKGRLHSNVDMLSRDPPRHGILEQHRLGDNVLYDFPLDMSDDPFIVPSFEGGEKEDYHHSHVPELQVVPQMQDNGDSTIGQVRVLMTRSCTSNTIHQDTAISNPLQLDYASSMVTESVPLVDVKEEPGTDHLLLETVNAQNERLKRAREDELARYVKDPLYYHPNKFKASLPKICVFGDITQKNDDSRDATTTVEIQPAKTAIQPTETTPVRTPIQHSKDSNKHINLRSNSLRSTTPTGAATGSTSASAPWTCSSWIPPSTTPDFNAMDLPVPRYVPASKGTDEGEAVPIDGVCTVCKSDQCSGQLLACDCCNKMTHTYCLDDIIPDGYVPQGNWFCPTCAPFTGVPGRVYLDIWNDQETLDAIIQGTAPSCERVRERAKNYTWDSQRKLLLTTETYPRIVPPPDKRLVIAKAAHESLGHRGFRSVSDALRLHYRWKEMRSDVQKAIQDCDSCKTKQLDLRSLQSTNLQPIPPSPIFTRWTVDLIGPLPTTKSNNKYVAVGVDSYTKLVVASALPNKTAASVVGWFDTEVVCRYGLPYQINCDRGGEFQGDFQTYCNKYSIKVVRGSAYHPQTQGLVERTNQTIEKALSSYTGSKHDCWDQHLAKVVFSINACKQASTKYSPFYLVHGIHARIPLQLPTFVHTEISDHDAAVAGLPQRVHDLNATHNTVLENISAAQDRQIRQHAKRKNIDVESEPLEIGKLVYMLCPGSSTAVEGPYRICEVTEHNVLLQDGEENKWSVHRNRIRISNRSDKLPVCAPQKRRLK